MTVDAALRRWQRVGFIALVIIVLAVPLSLLRRPAPAADDGMTEPAGFVGEAACRDCHQQEWEAWRGSDHDLAMAEASPDTVLGDFDDAELTSHGVTTRFYRRNGSYLVWTEGPRGVMGEFELAYVFGHDPLQQYLVPFPGGRLQALPIAWDALRGRWYDLNAERRIPPDDWLHWTRSGQNWNGMCAECHSTNLQKGYDPDTQTYHTTWSDIDVGCEACHGPGSRHVAWAEVPPMARPPLSNTGLVVPTSNISGPELVELCAPCHSRRAELGDYDHTGRTLLDHMLPSLLRDGLYFADGQIRDEVYVYASFLQSKMYLRGVTCSDCHDSHTLQLKREGNELCLQCHQREVYDTAEHHFHKKVYEGKPSDGALCVRCHAAERPYMVIDWRTDHSYRVPRPDLTSEIGTPNACAQAGCHADKPVQWAVDAYRKWYGRARRPNFGTTFAAAWKDDPRAADELVRLAGNTLQPAIVRATALELLERYPGEASSAALRAGLASDDALIRHTAVSSLEVADPAARADLLAPLLSDPVRAVRLAAVSKLAGTPRSLLKSYQQAAFDQALAEYRNAMAYSLDFASSGLNLGNISANLGSRRDAERYYRLALSIDDLFFPAKMNLAVLLAGEGRNAEAEALLREVLAAYPANPDAAYSLGLLLVEMGQRKEAEEWLARAAAALPSTPRVHYNHGLLLQQLGRLEEAEVELARALVLDPHNLELQYALADHYLRRGRPADALDIADRMIADHPEERIGRDLRSAAERALQGLR